MTFTRNLGRFAGLLYVLTSIVGFFAMGYVPKRSQQEPATHILLPQYQDKVYMYTQPAVIGEIVFMSWLLIKGAQPRVSGFAASTST